MLNMDTPAGGSSGSSPTPDEQERKAAGAAESGAAAAGSGDPGSFELPPKLRVHALAKLLGSSSREVITTLNSLGASVRSAQSNITREVALEVVRELRPEQLEQSSAEGEAAQDRSEPAETEAAQAEAAQAGSAQAEAAQAGAAQPAQAESAQSGSARTAEGTASGESQNTGEAPSGGSAPARPAAAGATNGGAANGRSEGSSSKPGSAPLAPVFAPPQATFLPPEPARAQPARTAEPAAEQDAAEEQDPAEEPAERATAVATEEAPSRTTGEDVDESAGEDAGDDTGDAGDTGDQDGEQGRRRRRRGRRGRGRGRGGDGESAENAEHQAAESGEPARNGNGRNGSDKSGRAATKDREEDAEADSAGGAQSADEESTTEATKRRRRRRRRKGGDDDGQNGQTREDDPPNTVVHVRETQEGRQQDSSDDEVRAIKGSTRLEAKRQRRRDGREAGRRRAPVLSESEFLARRESVERRMVVRESGDQTQIAVLEDEVLVENFVTSSGSGSLVGNVYLGRVQNVLPSMEAAFVDIGRGRNAVLYAGEVDWDAAGLAGKARRIEQALSTGDSVLVQVTKDPVGHKGARLTTQVSLPGRFLVYVPGGGATGISRKLPDNERKRLKEILRRIVPDNAGVIIRTASEGTSEEALDRDVRRLQAQWEIIKEKSEVPKAQAPQLLYEEPDLLIKVVRDLFTEDFSGLTVQGDGAWDTIEAYVQHVAPDLMSRLHKHTGKNDVFAEQRINEQISKALDRKVWLPSGGYLVVDRTEAMTVIDVNTGKFTGSGGNLEETVTRNNLEAAEEIVRQLRLRDIGGIIVIDFIDMVLESNRDLVLRRLTECLGRDRTRHQVAEVTSLGLVQMTRKRVGTGLLEAYSSTCEHCRGRGLMVSNEPVVHSHDHGNGGSKRGRRGKQNGQDESGKDSAKDSGKDSAKDGPEKGEKSDKSKDAEKSKDKGDRKGPKEDKREQKSGDKPVETKPAGDKPAGDKPAGEKPVGEKPVGEKPAEKSGGAKAAEAGPAAGKSAGDRSAEDAATKDAATKDAATKDRSAAEAAAGEAKPAPEKPTTEKPAPEKPAAEKPVAGKPAAGKPVPEQSAAEKAAEQAPAQAADAAAAQAPRERGPRQPEPAAQAAGEPASGSEQGQGGRSQRRKAGRPTTTASSAPAVVVAPEGGQSASEPVPEPERIEAPLPRKQRRRAVSRPATSPQREQGAE